MRALLSASGVLSAGLLLVLAALWTLGVPYGGLPDGVPDGSGYGGPVLGAGAGCGIALGGVPYGDLPYGDLPYGDLPYGDLPYEGLVRDGPVRDGGTAGATAYGVPDDARPGAGCPPFAAILFLPASWLPAGALPVVYAAVNAGLLALLVLFAARAQRAGPLLVAAAAGLWLETAVPTVLPGTAALAVACLLLWDLGRTDGSLGKGFALGIAAGIELTPAVFLVYCLLTGRVRAALTGLAAFAGTAGLGMLVLPAASAEFWTGRIESAAAHAVRPWELGSGPPASALASPYPLMACALLVAAAWRLGRTGTPPPGARYGTPGGVPAQRASAGPARTRAAGPSRAPGRQPSDSSSSASMIR